MIRICAILGSDIAYISRLADYINLQNRLGFKAVAYESFEEYKKGAKDYKIEILLADEDGYARLGIESTAACKVILSEDGYSRYKDAPVIYKYKAADEIMRELLCIYSDNSTERLIPATSKKAELVAIYSPINRIGKTSFSIAYASALSKKGRTLLITLEEFKGIFATKCDEESGDLSDVIYYFLQEDYSWSRLKSTVHSIGELDYIPPVRYAEDLMQLSDEDICSLFARISSESGYDHIVIDFGCFGKRAAVLLEQCDRIYLPVLDDSISQIKLNEFYNYLDISGREYIKNKITSLELPHDKGREHRALDLSDYLNGALYDKALELIEAKENVFEVQ